MTAKAKDSGLTSRQAVLDAAHALKYCGDTIGAKNDAYERLERAVDALIATVKTAEIRALREGEVMGAYMDFDRFYADKSWSSAHYLVEYGQFISEATVKANMS